MLEKIVSPPKSTKKLLLKCKTKDEAKKRKNLKIPLFFFINPIPTHRVYSDFLIPDFNNSQKPIYLFSEYMNYKSVDQVHIREGGIFFQFHDINPSFIAPLGLLQSRLNSLGNKFAHEMADFLPNYYSYFTKNEESSNCDNSEKSEKGDYTIKERAYEAIMPTSSVNAKLLEMVDEMLNDSKGNVAYFAVAQIYKGLDERFIMFGFNKECLSLSLIDEEHLDNAFENAFIEHCLQIFFFFSFENRMQDLKDFLLHVAMRTSEKYDYVREMKTIFGFLKAEFTLMRKDVEIEGLKFMLMSVVMKNDQYSILNNFKKNKQCILKKNEEFGKKREGKKGSDWENLLKYYYPKILETHSSEDEY